MSFISFFLKFFLRDPGSPPPHPHLPLGEDHMLHPSIGVGAAVGGGAVGGGRSFPSPPLPAPTTLLAWSPSGPGDARLLDSEALWLRPGDLWGLHCHQLL